MNRDRQLKKDMESREVQIHEEYEKNRHLMSEDKVKEHQKKQDKNMIYGQQHLLLLEE